MIEDGRYAATIDEIESERATVLLEADGEQRAELVVPTAALPTDEEGTVLRVEIEDGELVAARSDADATAARRRRRRARFDELAERPPGRDEEG
ncbi:MAG TPA: DUF3006 family protein [Natronoarchaeum rubrum]|nr:DUF3006 family protein [Natronoarchaeum rubrum]